MRDVRTGDVHQVRERMASQAFTAGALVCARVVPAGDQPGAEVAHDVQRALGHDGDVGAQVGGDSLAVGAEAAR